MFSCLIRLLSPSAPEDLSMTVHSYTTTHYRVLQIFSKLDNLLSHQWREKFKLIWNPFAWLRDWHALCELRKGCGDGSAKWHLPLTRSKWRGLAWANELQNEYMFKPHLKWRLWHCHANLERIQSAGINSVKLWLDFWRDQFVSKCVQSGLFVIMIRYLYLFLSFSCILDSISTQISLSYQVFEGRLEHNTVHHFERQG